MKKQYIPNLATLCYLIDGDRILLGRKKYGKAKGILNGFGGKVEYKDTSILASVKREFKEETEITLTQVNLSSILHIHQLDGSQDEITYIYAYLATKWSGEPQESEEMTFEWHDINHVPMEEMWEGDKHWFPTVIGDRKSLIHLFFNDEEKEPSKVEVELVEKIEEESLPYSSLSSRPNPDEIGMTKFPP